MGHKKLRIANTQADNLMANLRGEIAEVVTTWTLLRRFMATGAGLRSDDVAKDFSNPDLAFVYVLNDKLEDELVARLSELAEEKIGRLNFYFAAEKLGKFHKDASGYSAYIKQNKFREKRNRDISHKELPEKWDEHKLLHIPYRAIVGAVARALRLMKRIDRHVLGPSAPYLWREVRKRRYKPIVSPPRVQCMLVPYYYLSGEDRIRIVQEEVREGREVWSEMSTIVNGLPTKVVASRKWGVVMLGEQYLPLKTYPLVDLTSIELGPPWQPFFEERTIHARYRCKQLYEDKVSFEPVDREHRFPDGGATELVDIHISLNDEIRKSIGAVSVGDVKDFTLNVRVLAGFEVRPDTPGQGAALGQS